MKKFILTVLIISLWLAESFAGGWTLPKGKLWIKSAVFYQATDRRFCTEQDALSLAFRQAGCASAGHRAPFDPFIGGESTALAVFTEAAYGVTGWLDVGVQIPFYSLRFTNLANPSRPRRSNFGDVRFFAKYRVLQAPVVASLKAAAKSPTGKFEVDAEAINVSEGQWDFDFIGEVSKSFWPRPGYASLGVGYRFRTDNADFEHTLADELILLAEAGYEILPRLMIKGEVDWLRGQRPRLKLNGAPLFERRELLTFSPILIYQSNAGLNVEASVRFSLRGRDFPAGPQFMAALSRHFSLL